MIHCLACGRLPTYRAPGAAHGLCACPSDCDQLLLDWGLGWAQFGSRSSPRVTTSSEGSFMWRGQECSAIGPGELGGAIELVLSHHVCGPVMDS
jgi:hypothetical protein